MGQKFRPGFRQAAYRNLEIAESSYSSGQKDVSGYLFGIAGECALKEVMMASGFKPLPKEQRRDDPFYAHFEEIKAMLRDAAAGKLASRVFNTVTRGSLMQHWDISMRYAAKGEIQSDWVDRWRSDAKDLIALMEEC
jgi:hypothetical protein